MPRRPGSSWGFGALLKGTLVVVLKVERVLYIHSPHRQFLPARDSNSQPLDYESDSLTIRPRLPIKSIIFKVTKSSLLFRLSEEVVEWGQSNAVQSDWCWSQCECVCVCVCVCGGGGGGSEFSGAWGKRGEGGKDGREFSFLTAWWMKLSFSLKIENSFFFFFYIEAIFHSINLL